MMNIYFSLTERNQLNFPININDLSVAPNITKILDTNENKESDSDFKDSLGLVLNKEETEISQFYKKYGLKKNLFEKTQSQKKLNKIRIYVIVKSKIIKGKEVQYALPIRSFDDLGTSILERSNAFKSGIFDVKVGKNRNTLKNEPKYHEGSPDLGRRVSPFRFYLEHLVDPEPPFNVEEEFSLDNLVLPKNYGNYRAESPSKLSRNGRLFQNELFNEFEYNHSIVDNMFLINSSRYKTAIIHKNIFNRGEKNTSFLTNLKSINKEEARHKLFNSSNFFSLPSRIKSFASHIKSVVSSNTNPYLEKAIIPVFLNLEDAQEYLITILEEINQPFQVRRKIENSSTSHYSKSLNYLDDSFSFQNSTFSVGSSSRIKQMKDLLKKYRIIKLKDSENDFYNQNKYQTKRPFFSRDITAVDTDRPIPKLVKSTAKSLWQEIDYRSFLDSYFPGQLEEFSWWESRDITDTDKGLLKKSQDVKIQSMGLGDFLEFWNNPTKKKGKVLFIPSSNELSKKQLNLSFKKSRDRFYDYQQKFRDSRTKENENYIYNIKILS